MAVDQARETALKMLYDINEKGAYSNIAMNKYLENSRLSNLDKGFVTELVYGSVKWKLTIDWYIEQFSSIKLKKISPWILNILRLGVYQLIYMDRIPESAACNESVNLSKKYGHSASSRYVNGVLRNIARNSKDISFPDPSKDQVRFLSVKYSHPEWMVEEWVKRYGAAFTEKLLESNNEVPDISVRINTLKVNKEQLINALKDEGIEVARGKYSEDSMLVRNPTSIARLQSFKDGWFQVQDESSMLVGKILDPKPGELVMDVCSAPGGKATHIAELMKNQGVVIARDVHEHKIKIIDEAAQRLGIDILKTEIFDASVTDSRYEGKADRVLVDAPCTGLGIIRRKPDIKWTRSSGDKKEIVALQEKILYASSRYVKSGGTLVYSTCTIEPEENEEMVDRFIKNNPVFGYEDISGYLPEKLRKPGAPRGYIQLYPNVNGIDGFFIAKLSKK